MFIVKGLPPMIDIAKILALPPKERDDEIRKLLGIRWKHKWNYGPNPKYPHHQGMKWLYVKTTCKKCGAGYDRSHYNPCPCPDPIPLDWKLAMKMRDEAVAKDRDAWIYAACLVENVRIVVAMKREWTDQDKRLVEHEAEWDGISQWFIDFAQPHHYILAAFEAKGGGG